jgi:hypothetical protein
VFYRIHASLDRVKRGRQPLCTMMPMQAEEIALPCSPSPAGSFQWKLFSRPRLFD